MKDTTADVNPYDIFTLDELDDLLDAANVTAVEELPKISQVKLMKALALVLMKRTNPDTTLKEVGAMKLSELVELPELKQLVG